MITCANCGRESPDDFAFCPACAAPLRIQPAADSVRAFIAELSDRSS